MRNYYRAILGEVYHVYHISPEVLHTYLKVGYQIRSTREVERYPYLQYTLRFVEDVFGMYFDTDRYKNE